MGKQANRLSDSDKYKLARWVEDRKDHASKTAGTTLAIEASRDLNLSVTPANMRSAKKTLGMETAREARSPTARMVRTTNESVGIMALVLLDTIKWIASICAVKSIAPHARLENMKTTLDEIIRKTE